MTGVPLGAGREFDRIRAIAAALGDDARELGDDCAMVEPGPGSIVVSTDVSVQDVHFRRDWLTFEEIGWRAAAAALSDLAAEGAECVGVLAAVTAPRESAERDLVDLMRGIGAAARSVGGRVLGGDLSAGPAWSIAVTVVGRAGRPILRAGARAGDGLWVTGALGAARAALEAWRAGRVPSAAQRQAFAHPEPRIAAGRWLSQHGVTAMLDLSDGLGADAQHLAAASDVGLAIDLGRVPVSPAVGAAAGDEPGAVFAARGGEDYELLAALPPGFAETDAELLLRDCGVALTRIGSVVGGSGVSLTLDGAPVHLTGYDHFS